MSDDLRKRLELRKRLQDRVQTGQDNPLPNTPEGWQEWADKNNIEKPMGAWTPKEVLQDKEKREDLINMLGMAGGGLVGGPVGSAGGYALSEILNRRIAGNPEDTTWTQAAKDLGVGAAYEFIPRVGIAALRQTIPKGLINRLSQSALHPSPSKGLRHAKRAVKTQLKNELPISEEGLNKAWKIVKERGKSNRDIVSALDAAGETVDPQVMYASMIKYKNRIKDLPPTSATRDAIQHVDDLVTAWKARYGTKPIPYSEALRIKQTGDEYLSTFWRQLEGGKSNVATPLDKTIVSEGINGLRKALNKNPKILANNKEISPILSWLQDAERRVVMQRNKSLIPFGTAETIGVSKALGGNVPLATAAVGGRAFLMQPSVASKVGLALNRAKGPGNLTQALIEAAGRRGVYAKIPPAWVNKSLTDLLSGDN